ncbi:MAG: type II toxin-antitoxin system VapC family toxin [Opitutaceae bacterium]
MIQLDANYLILGLIASTPQGAELRRWITEGEAASTSAIAWMEFVTGPVQPDVVESARRILEDRIVPIGRDEAELAASLFNLVGRRRALRYDCIIAATAIRTGARLATADRGDFALFAPHGLELA